MFEEIAGWEKWSKVERINKGWSSDIKYYIEGDQNQRFLLRISGIETFEQKRREYEMISKYASLGFQMSKPIDFGKCSKRPCTYMLLSWVDGQDLEAILPDLSEERQYELGQEAGRILRCLHSLEVPVSEQPVVSKVAKKKNQLQRYLDSNLRIPQDEIAIRFIEENISRIGDRQLVYQHGDFHPGNLILTPEGRIGVIDFNRSGIGDPYEEFYKLESFGTEVSIPYCIGQIDAYFNKEVPDEFWDTLAVYVAHAALYSIKWAEPYGQDDIDHMIEICKKSFIHYDAFKRRIPTWYPVSRTTNK